MILTQDWESLCSLNFKSHNFQTESHLKRVTPTNRGSTTLSFLVLQLRSLLRTLWIQNPAYVKQCIQQEAKIFCARPSNWTYVWNWHKQVFFGTKDFLHSANLQATIQAAGLLRVPPKSVFKQLLLGTGLWQHAKNEHLPQVSQWVEECQVQERAAEQLATHSIRAWDRHRYA